MAVLLTCVYVCYVYAWCFWRSGEGIGSSGTGVMDGCEPSLSFDNWHVSSLNAWV